ncbi:recombinase [Geomonas limicola]|uniref:Recombinase n=1 Tax=Geomonas limicola TaxID=2740186 RepID=A0A6V8N4J6_9BACT|nr:site-specific integrase [Geomonas limicola]GFO67498.1 recombinase [Geomonas limicola]
MKITHIIMETGERLPMLLLDDGVPDFWATLFVGKRLRNQAQNSIERGLNAVRHLRGWEEYHERDLSQEFRDGNFLSEIDVLSITEHCAYEAEDFQKWAAKKKQESNRPRTASVAGLLALKIEKPLKTVQFDTQYNRISTIAKYLKFLAETASRVRPDKRESKNEIERMYKDLLSKRPKPNSSRNSRGRYAHIPATAYRRFKELASPDHVDNPFRKGKSAERGEARTAGEVRKRNHLLVEIAYELGLRGGEILGLWVEDIQFGPKPTLSVVRRHNHPLDPRKKQAVAKTQERTLRLSRELASALNHYILNERAKHPFANRHPILFVVAQAPWNGRPLSVKSFGEVFESIAQVDPDNLGDISPHGLRHDRACRFVDDLRLFNQTAKKKDRIPEEEFGQLLKDYFGWKDLKSAAVYLKRRTKERLDEGFRQFQRGAFDQGDQGDEE